MHAPPERTPDNSTDEETYDFVPLKNDSSDETTQSLFEQLEEGAEYYTDLYGTVKAGANLYAKKTGGAFEGCLPIHIAAHNIGCNTDAIDSLLSTFDNAEERKKYLYKADLENKNTLEILVEHTAEHEKSGCTSCYFDTFILNT